MRVETNREDRREEFRFVDRDGGPGKRTGDRGLSDEGLGTSSEGSLNEIRSLDGHVTGGESCSDSLRFIFCPVNRW